MRFIAVDVYFPFIIFLIMSNIFRNNFYTNEFLHEKIITSMVAIRLLAKTIIMLHIIQTDLMHLNEILNVYNNCIAIARLYSRRMFKTFSLYSFDSPYGAPSALNYTTRTLSE